MNKSVDRRSFLSKTGIAAVGAALILPSCKSTTVNEEDSYTVDKSFSTDPKNFDYLKANSLGKRSEGNMLKHRPRVKVAKNKQEFFVDFKNKVAHPHVHGHWWSWIELTDQSGNSVLAYYPEPEEGETLYGDSGKDFVGYIASKKVLNGWVKVRAMCETHGVYIDYIEV